MSGLLPTGYETVNEAAAWALNELAILSQGAALAIAFSSRRGMAEAASDSVEYRNRHNRVADWLAVRNRHPREQLKRALELVGLLLYESPEQTIRISRFNLIAFTVTHKNSVIKSEIDSLNGDIVLHLIEKVDHD